MAGDVTEAVTGPDDRLRALEQTVRRLTDLEEIRGLAAEYQRLCDGGWDGPTHADPDALTRLFTDDAEYALPTCRSVTVPTRSAPSSGASRTPSPGSCTTSPTPNSR